MSTKRYWDPETSLVERSPNLLVVSCEQPGLMAAPHWHAQPEVNYVFRGAVEYEMHGHRVRLEAGTVALFWGGLPHRVVDIGDDTYFQAIHLPLTHFFRLRLAPDLQQRLMRGATLVTLEPAPDDAPAFTRRARYLTSEAPHLVEHATDELLLRLERIVLEPHALLEPRRAPEPALSEAESGGSTEQSSFQSIRRISGYIAENFREDIDCTAIAGSADIHPKYAMSVFKRATGMSMGEYINLLRVSYAQSLLRHDDLSILEIAMDSGFGSVSSFNKCFRKKCGLAPTEFRREFRLASRSLGSL